MDYIDILKYVFVLIGVVLILRLLSAIVVYFFTLTGIAHQSVIILIALPVLLYAVYRSIKWAM